MIRSEWQIKQLPLLLVLHSRTHFYKLPVSWIRDEESVLVRLLYNDAWTPDLSLFLLSSGLLTPLVMATVYLKRPEASDIHSKC